MMITITVNGQPRTLPDGGGVLAEVLSALGYTGGTFAVAINGDFVPRQGYADTIVTAGTDLEIVAPMQGG